MVAYLPDGTRLLAGYVPSNVLSVIGLIVYGLLAFFGFLHLWRMGRKFMITLLVGLTFMTIGFVLRIILAGSPGSLGIYVITTLLLLLSPCAFLAADYIILSRLSRHLGDDTVGQECLIIPPSLLVKLFCWSDGLTFFLQMSGGGLSASEGKAELGKYITLVGLGIQLVSFSLYAITLVLFGVRVKSRFPAVWSAANSAREGSLFAFWRTNSRSDWTTLYFALLTTTIGIMIRCIFRFVEYTQGYDGYLASHEAFFYLLDALPLALAMLLFIAVWPPRFLPVDIIGRPGLVASFPSSSSSASSSPRKMESSLLP